MKPPVGDPADGSFGFGCQDSKGMGAVAREGVEGTQATLWEALSQLSLEMV